MITFDQGRQRPANYIAICNNIADSYPNGIAHGLQKDAIQNAVDARKGKQKVRVHFNLIENSNGNYLTITDSKTIGLTGPVLYDSDSYEDDLPEDFHWARFESFAFTKEDPDAIGARGQGKFIFLRSSREYTMYYDTLRHDGIYRVGATQATRTGCPILPPKDSEVWEGRLGASKLHERFSIQPITEVGSRIVIVDPIEEVCTAIKNGTFLGNIEETWFRAIEKQVLEILVSHSGKTHYAKVPSPYPLSTTDSSSVKTWKLGKDYSDRNITIQNIDYRIKNFHAIYSKDEDIPADLQGIAIIQNGMKITSIEMAAAPSNIRERITGFIEFDQKLKRELRKGENQHPNHYNLKWRRRIPYSIRNYINQQLDDFGQKKLGLGTDQRKIKKRKRNNAEEWAMRQLLTHAKDLDLFGARGRKKPPIDSPPLPFKTIGVSINNFIFPDPHIAPRVNWDHQFDDVEVTAFNRTDDDLNVSIQVLILHGDSIVFQPIDKIERILNSKESFQTSAFDINISQYQFSAPGIYRISASLFNVDTGDRLDQVSRRFWVEKDPPLRQPFLLQPLPEFPEPYSYRQWYTSGSINNSPTLFYNLAHPSYRLIEEDEDSQAEYIFDIVLSGAVDFVLRRPNREDGTPDFHPLESENILGTTEMTDRDDIPIKTYQELAKYISEIRWRVFEGTY